MLCSKPIIVGHRANTRLRLYYYLSLGLPVIEVDVTRTEEGELIIQHVREEEVLLEELRSKKRKLLHSIHEELEELFHRKLVDYLRAISGKTNVMLDLKYRSKGIGIAEAIEKSNYKGEIYVTSKYHRDLVLVKKCLPQAKVLLAIEDEPLDVESYLEKAGVDGVSIRAAFVEEDMVKQLHEHNHIVAVWVVDDPELAIYLTKLGVDMIITDKPREIMKALNIEIKRKSEIIELVRVIEEILGLI